MNDRPAAHRIWLFLLVGALPFSDFLQIGIFAFNAAPVMGDLGASPEEYSVVATLYAVTAIGIIFNHRWLVERMGWRWFIRLSCAFFVAGSLTCAASQSLGGFTIGRLLTALGCASFMTAARVLVNLLPPSPLRFTGIRFLASGIAWGVTCGPLAASMALASSDWRMAYLAQLIPAFVIAVLGELALPCERLATRTPFDLRGLLALAGGSALLLFAEQRSTFDFFSMRSPLYGYVALGLMTLVLTVWLVLSSKQPALRLHDMSQRRYLIGLAVFGLCYGILGANNTAIPMLLRSLDLPLYIAARYVAIGSSGGIVAWIILSRLVPRNQGPARYYFAGFLLLTTAGVLIGRMSETASIEYGILPALFCAGAFVITVLSTTAVQTFRDVQRDETVFSHANQIKNVLAQLGIASGICAATLFSQWRLAQHYVRFSEVLGPDSLALQGTLRILTQRYGASADPAKALQMAYSTINGIMVQQASFMASLDYFTAIAAMAALCLLAVLGERAWRISRKR
ncbi:MFS transporter [Variovorax sp. UC122_21]|uniref:MFS transporter n=1 Tax=Variovorax TaxID=34072 RepID=UPI001932480C|nr:MFS transporter [Variovorax paradoxus]